MDQASPVSDSSSHDTEKGLEARKNEDSGMANLQNERKGVDSLSTDQDTPVVWNGPDDLEYPQNL